MDDSRDGFPELLAALENAPAGTFIPGEAMRALIRELHRLYQECAALRRRLDAIENAARMTPGYSIRP